MGVSLLQRAGPAGSYGRELLHGLCTAGSAAGKLESRQPDQAGGLERLRIGVIALQVVYFFAGGYGNGTVLTLLAAAMILLVIGILLNLHSVEAS